ncbi:MAG TPA: 16S rRNA (cytosine(1402)-N(4))-methyltransferase RsmH [Acidiferrobacterales bacterium]|nr:16S rRNA (cytosine(1402)-N(4))-methyltransferase RsmH [Acidiferrobacterales bacterium]
MTEREHEPVLREEAVAALNIRPDGIYVDATFGRGGHARSILEQLGPHGRLLALDRDPQAVASATQQFADEVRLTIVHAPFSMLGSAVAERGWRGRVNGVLFDLGVSSPQLDDPARGFSFRTEGPLDMRMDSTRGESAADWLNRAAEQEIADVLFQLGEERYARRIARAILRARAATPITTTKQLAEIVAGAVPTRERSKDPATRSFQAIRLHINRELDELRETLPQAMEVLAPHGRLVVISFHSLEDRIVKQFMRTQEKGRELPLDLPVRHIEIQSRLKVIGKPVRAGEDEVRRNPRARSAVLRVAEIPEAAHA